MTEPETPKPAGDRNPYAAPATVRAPHDLGRAKDTQLAERGTRLGAVLINGVLTALATIPGFVLGFSLLPDLPREFGEDFRSGAALTWLLVLYSGVILLWIFQAYLLARDGQSIGKKLLDIKIVRYDNGERAGFGRVVLLREVVNTLISFVAACIPLIGLLYPLADTLCIFGRERRCLHDYLAGTRVVTVTRPRRRYRRPPASTAESRPAPDASSDAPS